MPKPTTKTREEIRSLFVRNAIPTEQDYAALIAAGLNQADDGILKLPDQPLGLVRQMPPASVPPSSAPSSPSTASAPAPSGVLNFYGAPEDDSPSWQLQLIGSSNPDFGLADQSGTTRLFVDGTTGNLGIGTSPTDHKLTVAGTLNTVKDSASSLTNAGQLAIKGDSVQLDFIDTDHQIDWAINVENGKLSFVRAPDRKDLVLDGKGNVGIGTETPKTKLHIAGIIQASGYRFAVEGFEFELNDGLLTPLNKQPFVFSFTNNHQVLTVPAGVEWIFVKLWGAGGGAGRGGHWECGADGGGGGHTKGLFKVTPNQGLIIVVGQGGTTANGDTFTYGYGGTNRGARREGGDNYCGHGGGLCGIFRMNDDKVPDKDFKPPITDAIAVAGGGGGGGGSRWYRGNAGGAGGGLCGQRGAAQRWVDHFSAGGGGGSQTQGGRGGSVSAKIANENYYGMGGNGRQWFGGVSGDVSNSGAGGGGFLGGGGGAFIQPRSWGDQTRGWTMGGGGGGSGYTSRDGLLTGTYTGNFRVPAYSCDPDLQSDLAEAQPPGYGGLNQDGNIEAGSISGGHARAVIYY